MAKFRFVPMNWHDQATLSSEFSMVTGFDVQNTQNHIRSRVMKTTSAADQWIGGVLPSNRTANFFGFFRHRCHGGNVRLILYSDAAFTTSVYDSTVLPVLNVVGSDPYNFGINDTGLGGADPFVLFTPYWKWFASTTFRSYKIFFSSKSPTYGYSYWQASRIWLGKYFEASFDPDYGMTIGWADKTDSNRSRGGSLRTNQGPKWRVGSVDFANMSEDDRAAWLDIMYQCGMSYDFVVSIMPELNNRLERDHIINGKFVALDSINRPTYGNLAKKLQVQEI